MSKEIKFDCVKNITSIKSTKKGYVLEVKIGSWNDGDIGVDVRYINETTERMGKGAFMTFEDFNKLVEVGKLIKNTYTKKVVAKKTTAKKATASKEMTTEEKIDFLMSAVSKLIK